MKPVIKETVIRQIELDNLNYQVEFDFFGKHPDDDCWDYEWVQDYDGGIGDNSVYWKENEHVPIEMLRETIEKLEAEGATHVQIYPHGDHQSYYITGVRLEVLNEEEAKKREIEMLTEAVSDSDKDVEKKKEEFRQSESRNDLLKRKLNFLKIPK